MAVGFLGLNTPSFLSSSALDLVSRERRSNVSFRRSKFTAWRMTSLEVGTESLHRRGAELNIDTSRWFETEQPNGDLRPPIARDGALRLFGKAEKDVRVTLFRDPAYWCPYCQRVQLQLEYKQIPYRVRTVNMRCYGSKPAYYRTMVPSGAVPAIQIDDQPVMTESMDIMLMLEDLFPETKKLIPPQESPLYDSFRKFAQLERRVFSIWFQYMFSGGFGMFGGGDQRKGFLAALESWDAATQELQGDFLLGDDLCLVDVLAVPFVERMVASALYWKGINIRTDFPGIDRWLLAMETKVQAYQALQGDLYSTVHDLPPQCGNGKFEAGSEPFQKFVDGQSGSWELPLPPIDENFLGVLRGDSRSEEDYKLEAAASVLKGSEKLVPFAMRAVGMRPRTVSAPLSDPDAQPVLWGQEWVELALAGVASALIHGTDHEAALESAAKIPADEKKKVVACLSYLRDRIGVPRDMSFGAARQLRAHLNWFSKETVGAEEWTRLKPKYDVSKA